MIIRDQIEFLVTDHGLNDSALINLIWTPAATNPLCGNGTITHFYAIEDGIWLVKVFAVPMGTGAVGVFTVS